MKIKTFFLMLCISFTTQAGPGDDIWDNIATLNGELTKTNLNVSILQQTVGDLQTRVANIPRGEKGEKGERGEKGATGAPGTYTAGEGITIENDIIKITKPGHRVGDEYRGGVVFYVDESGEHGLIASKIDINGEGVQWRNGASGNKVTNARGDGIGAGETNTRLIIAQQTVDNQNGVFAALLTANFQILEDGVTPCQTPMNADLLCYGGWYLPSAFELQLLHKNLHQNGLMAFAEEFYWSSTEASVANAWLQNLSTGEITASSKSNTLGRVRAVSRF